MGNHTHLRFSQSMITRKPMRRAHPDTGWSPDSFMSPISNKENLNKKHFFHPDVGALMTRNRFSNVSFKNIKRVLSEADSPMCAWEVYQRYMPSKANQGNVHAALYKLFQYGKLTRRKVHAKPITGRDEQVFEYCLV